MDVGRIDHLVLYVEDIEATSEFYARAVEAEVSSPNDNRPDLVIHHPPKIVYLGIRIDRLTG